MRTCTNLNKDWYFSKNAAIEEISEELERLELPHTWNAIDGQDGGNDYWRGTAVYLRELDIPERTKGQRAFLEFQGAAMTAEVFVNGKKAAEHAGGYSTFRADITDYVKQAGKNLLRVTVDNSENDRVYPQKADFTFYGGIYRDVNLILTEPEHFELIKDGTSGIKVTPVVDLEKKSAKITLEAWCSGGDTVLFQIGEQFVEAAVKDGYARGELLLEQVHLWNGTEDPFLYLAEAVLISGGTQKDRTGTRFGCRSFSIDPEKGFFLNGRSYPLRGVSRHQDRAGVGSAITLDMMKEDLAVVKEIGANTLRLAHYQQAQEFYDLCDENGLIVWAEIPYITAHMENGRENTLSQMRELVTQCYHHPSIICWGLSNEITASGQVTEDLLENHRLLNELCHKLDATRLTTMAHVFMLETDSPLTQIPDIGSYNLYFGWYLGELEDNEAFFDEYHKKFPRRVIGFSEYGADANPAYHSAQPGRGDYSEEYQCLYHEHMLRMIEKRPYLWATHVWNLFDFAADGREEGGKKGVNQKGLVEMDHKTKKDAFYLYKAYWSNEPFVHLCGKRYKNRETDTTEIRVYSNQKEVTLFVDGKEVAKKAGEKVFLFSIPLSGEHHIEAKAGDLFDEMYICKVEEKDPEYAMAGSQEIVNWFDKEDYKPDHFSIKDKLGELMQDPKAGSITREIMDKAMASRGDVAKSTAGNENLQKMLAAMSLESILKQAGPNVASEEDMRQINAALQKIPK